MFTYQTCVHGKSGVWTLLYARTYILCTKSPKRLRYAESFDGPEDFEIGSGETCASPLKVGSSLLDRSPFLEVEVSSAVVSASMALWSVWWACVCECPEPSFSPPRTRSVFSIKKNVANPMNIPSLLNMGVKTRDRNLHLRQGYRTHPIRIFRFSSTITKWAPRCWCSPMNEWGTRCRKTSESKPPVCGGKRKIRSWCWPQSRKEWREGTQDSTTHSKCSHSVQGVAFNLSGYKSKYKVGYPRSQMNWLQDR